MVVGPVGLYASDVVYSFHFYGLIILSWLVCSTIDYFFAMEKCNDLLNHDLESLISSSNDSYQ